MTSDGAVLTLDDGSVYSVDAADQSTVSSWSQGDQVSVAGTGDAITNLSTGEKVTVTSVGNSSDTNVYPNTGDHTQTTNSSDGSIIVLEDGSIWIVAPTDQATTSLWLDTASITVNDGSSTPAYDLVNTDNQETATANYIGQE
jgi:hypothetical protein